MSANYESGVTYGARAWHGLDNNLSADDQRRFSVSETIEQAGMDWTVTKMPLAIAQGNGELSGTPAEDVFGVFRTDTWKCLAPCGPDYRCLQNRDIFAQFQPFLDARELAFESAGALDGGKRVFVQAALNVEDGMVGNADQRDAIRAYLLIASSHDGSLATNVLWTPQRVVCANTLAMAFDIAESKKATVLRVKHTKAQDAKLADIMATVDVARQQFASGIATYNRLAQVACTQDTLKAYVKDVLGIDKTAKREELSTRIVNQYDRIFRNAVWGKGQPQGFDGLTLWHAYNGVTQWTSHDRTKGAEATQKSVWFGASATTNAKALQLALALAS